MGNRPADTTAAAWALVEAGMRAKTPAQRIRRCIDLTILTHRAALVRIRQRYPAEDDRRHRMRLAARYIEPELMKKAFGFPEDD